MFRLGSVLVCSVSYRFIPVVITHPWRMGLLVTSCVGKSGLTDEHRKAIPCSNLGL